ncbi:MAG: dipicolinate synthase subunit B [Clostridiales bacterium]|nr:dipicolinate synthase subunit B [Clostridiales bacterium]
MELANKTIGFAMCGSFCTFKKSLEAAKELQKTGANIIPIMSETAYSTDTRFGTCIDFRNQLELICGNKILHTVYETEPIGPKKMLDALVILPCTGNTLAKLSHAVADSSVTLAAKAHLRNKRPLIIGVSTNDGLGNAAENIGRLLSRKHCFFIPFAQDDCIHKPNSLIADFSKLNATIEMALENKQLQPILAV